MISIARRPFIALAVWCVLAACACTSTGLPTVSQSGSPSPQPSASPLAGTRLYVANFATSVLFYGLPITSGSDTQGVVSGFASAWSECTDSSGRLFVVDKDNNRVDVYDQPISSGSGPAFSLVGLSTPSGCAVDAGGNVYVSEEYQSDIAVFPGPVSGTAVPSSKITNNVAIPCGVGVDPNNGNVFVANRQHITEYAPLSAGNAFLVSFGEINDNYGVEIGPDGNLYVANGPAEGVMDVYKPPFTSSSAPDHTVTLPGAIDSFYFTWDSNNFLYVAAYKANWDSDVYVFAPPYTGSPTAILFIANVAPVNGTPIWRATGVAIDD